MSHSDEFAKLAKEIVADPSKIKTANLTYEQLVELKRLINPMRPVPKMQLESKQKNGAQKMAVISYLDIKEEYYKRLSMTAMISFVNQMLHEYTFPKDQVALETSNEIFNIDNLHDALKSLLELTTNAKIGRDQALIEPSERAEKLYRTNLFAATNKLAKLGKAAMANVKHTQEWASIYMPEVMHVFPTFGVEITSDYLKKHTEQFFNHMFKFNPAEHVRKGGVDSDVTPPQDTFHRFNHYYNANYAKLRTITEKIYPERTEYNQAIAVWKVFEGTEDEMTKQFENFCSKFQDETINDLLLVEMGSMITISNITGDKDNISVSNKHTDALDKIFTRHKDDRKLGHELLKRRIQNSREQNIREHGPLDPQLDKKRFGISSITREEQLRTQLATQYSKEIADELEYLDGLLARQNYLDELKASRTLGYQEQLEYKQLLEKIIDARRNIEIPNDQVGIQVHVMDGEKITTSDVLIEN